ncbi:MAG: hypothetical protein Q8P58_03025 [Candidatus Adlerbacteria bacterium]|nr:hypothetical protein [Candidatus Adlerbacteria bacterium]
MKKFGLFGLAALFSGLLVLPLAASAQSYYSNYSYSYPSAYPYYNDYNGDVACFPETQTIEEGQIAYFTAFGGDGEYDWEAEGRLYNNRDRYFSHRFDDTGTERVTVESDNERDTCRVTVVRRSYYAPTYPAYPTYPTYTPPVNVVTTYVPKGLPNTGFPPVSSAALAFAAVLLLGVGLALTPYAKKITAAIR